MKLGRSKKIPLALVLSLSAVCAVDTVGARHTLLSSPPTPSSPAARAQGRLAPPDSIKCPHNNLTVYEGRVTSYSRNARRTFLRMRTDADTNESVTIRHGRSTSPAKWFLLRAEPFEASDWKLIERSRGRLRPGMRAHVWVCDDGSNPIVDWQPPVD
jgi:hypothetical protein